MLHGSVPKETNFRTRYKYYKELRLLTTSNQNFLKVGNRKVYDEEKEKREWREGL